MTNTDPSTLSNSNTSFVPEKPELIKSLPLKHGFTITMSINYNPFTIQLNFAYNTSLGWERFSSECWKTKVKVIIVTNHNQPSNPENQSKLGAIHIAEAKRGKTCARSHEWSWFYFLIGSQSGAGFLSQSCSVVTQDQSEALQGSLKNYVIRI